MWTLLSTGARMMEILELQTSQVDLKSGTIKLDKHKWSPWVFPGKSKDGHFADIQYGFYRVCAHAGIVITEDCVPHGLRRRFATILADLGRGLPLIGACLGHSDPRTTAIYARPSAKATRIASQDVAAALGGCAPWERRAAA